MRTKLVESNKPERYIHNVRNVDTSAAGATIPAGSPLIMNLSPTPQPSVYSNGLPPGWEDGLQVVLPGTAGATGAQLYYYGVAAAPIIYQQYGEAVVHGMCQALVVRATRSATSAPWASASTVSVSGDALVCDTANNAFSTATISPLSGYSVAPMVLVDNFTTMASSASNATDTRTAASVLCRAFVRQM